MPTDERPRDPPPAAEASLDRLRRAGWSVAEYTIWYVGARALAWVVVIQSGEAPLLAAGPTRDEALWWACEKAGLTGEPADPDEPPAEVDAA